MTYSILAQWRRREFDKTKTKALMKYVYYLGSPPNNECDEFFDREHLAIAWIQQNTGLKLVSSVLLEQKKGKDYERIYDNCVISFDKLTIHWNYTFHLNEQNIQYYGYAYVADTHIIISAGSLEVYIYQSQFEHEQGEIIPYEYKLIHFIAPVPQLESVNMVEELNYKTLYTFKIYWNNTKVKILEVTDRYKITYDIYTMIVYEQNIRRAVIKPI